MALNVSISVPVVVCTLVILLSFVLTDGVRGEVRISDGGVSEEVVLEVLNSEVEDIAACWVLVELLGIGGAVEGWLLGNIAVDAVSGFSELLDSSLVVVCGVEALALCGVVTD